MKSHELTKNQKGGEAASAQLFGIPSPTLSQQVARLEYQRDNLNAMLGEVIATILTNLDRGGLKCDDAMFRKFIEVRSSLTVSQQELVNAMHAQPGWRLIRLRGGYWVLGDGVQNPGSVVGWMGGTPRCKYWGTTTVHALIRKGILSGSPWGPVSLSPNAQSSATAGARGANPEEKR